MKRIYNQFLKSYFIISFICKGKKSNYFVADFSPVLLPEFAYLYPVFC